VKKQVNHRIDKFYGLNNMLYPASAEYYEGMAYRAKDARINEEGVWSPRALLVGCSFPPSLLGGWGNGNHCKYLAVDNTNTIIACIGTKTSVDVGANGYLYGTTGDGKVKYKNASGGGDVDTFTPLTLTATTGNGTASRAENGTYYYMCTRYDPVRQRESLPSAVHSAEIDHDDGGKDRITLTSSAPGKNIKVRFYRTLRTCAAEGVYNATNIFYFVFEKSSGDAVQDYMHDDDIRGSEYEGRGSKPPEDIDYLASYNNRMLYFKGNTLYWSSANQPEDVALDYTITYGGGEGDTVDCKPKLSLGVYGEAKYEISELSGQKVLAAMRKDGKLWIWTASMVGYLKATNRLEGYRFTVVRRGLGVTSDKVLAYTPYGIFGADRQGMWLIDNSNRIYRLTDGVVDIKGGTDTTLSQSKITDSFGVWVPALNEYWWCVGSKQIAYQANRGIFAGPYTYSISGGCDFVSAGGAQTYLNGMTPSATTADSCTTYLEFWMGQSEPTAIKDQLEVEIIHADSSGNVSATVYQNSIASETGSTNNTVTYSGTTGKVVCSGSGRLFKLKLESSRKYAAINYKYNAIGWTKEDGR